MDYSVLLVDDEVRSLETLRRTLDEDFVVHTASSAAQAHEILARHEVHVVLCDQRMPQITGVEFLSQVRERYPNAVRMILSGYTDSGDIIRSINEGGIYQFIQKPWLPEHLLTSLRAACEVYRLNQENAHLALELRASADSLLRRKSSQLQQIQQTYHFDKLIREPGQALDLICRQALQIARYDIPVLIGGPSGTGKELMGRAVHYASPRAERPFVVENCAAIPDTLLESELFGHKRGAFTGAHEDHTGLFARANGGTAFLDEIGDTSPQFQVKLLRVLESGEIRPVGSTKTRAVDVRIICASHKDLAAEVRAGRFREDLYYRIAGFEVTLPGLRERSLNELWQLAKHVLAQASRALGKPCAGISDAAMTVMANYAWPGNIRELKNELYRALALSQSTHIEVDDLSPRLHQKAVTSAREAQFTPPEACQTSGVEAKSLREHVERLETHLIIEAMRRHDGNKSRVAQALGLSRLGLRGKLARLGLTNEPGDFIETEGDA